MARVTNVGLYEELVAFAKNRQAGGMATGLDTARLETQLENERQRLELAKGEVERAKLTLLNSMENRVRSQAPAHRRHEGRRENGASLTLSDSALEAANTDRLEIKAELQRIRTAELSIRPVKGERLPSLSAEGNYGLISLKFDNNPGPTRSEFSCPFRFVMAGNVKGALGRV